MAAILNEFQHSIGDWRSVLEKNKQRTLIVILTFIALYLAVGLLIDVVIYSQRHTQVSIGQIFIGILRFEYIPYATIASSIVAIISLFVTFSFHDKLMLLGADSHEVDQYSENLNEKKLFNVVEEMKVAAGLKYMPKIYIIEADYMNAFASGYSEKSALVAITRGLLEKLDRSELQAVMAHELSHIRHMDIKLTLFTSVLSNLITMMIDMLFWNMICRNNKRSGDGGANKLLIVVIVLRSLLPIVTLLLKMFLSRTREYMADAGCVELMRDNEPLARALMKIQGDHEENHDEYAEAYNKTAHESVRNEAYIFDPVKAGISSKNPLASIFSTHPSTDDRLDAMGFKKKS